MKRIVALLTVGMMLLGSLMVGASAKMVEVREEINLIPTMGYPVNFSSGSLTRRYTFNRSNGVLMFNYTGVAYYEVAHEMLANRLDDYPGVVKGERYELFVGGRFDDWVRDIHTFVNGRYFYYSTAGHKQYFSVSGTLFTFHYSFEASADTKNWFSNFYVFGVPGSSLVGSHYIDYDQVILTHIYEVEIPEYALTPTASEGGKISPSEAQMVEQGKSSTFSIEPEPGYFIKDVTVNGESVGAVDTYTFANVSADGTIHAEFEAITYQMRSMSAENGSIRPTGEWTVREGEPVTFFFTPDKGYRVAEVRVNEEPVGAVSSYTVDSATADLSVEVDFAPLPPGVVMGTDGYNGLLDGLSQVVGVVVPVGIGVMGVMMSIRLLPRLIKRMLGQS